jgi:hypothetical protein
MAASQWLPFSGTPTYLSPTSFSVVGDQRATFAIGARVQSNVTAGIAYSQVVGSSFGSGVTTVTLVNTHGVLDSGLSLVSVGIISPDNTSAPVFTDLVATITTTVFPCPGTTLIPFTSFMNDNLAEFAGSAFHPRVAGAYLVKGRLSTHVFAGTAGIGGQSIGIMAAKNGVLPSPVYSQLNWPFPDGVTRDVEIPIVLAIALAAGDTLQLAVNTTFAITGSLPEILSINNPLFIRRFA